MPKIQSESERGAPWGGAHDEPLPPMRPRWVTAMLFMTDHGTYKILDISSTHFYATYVKEGVSDLWAVSIKVDGTTCPNAPLASRQEAVTAIKLHHREVLRQLRAAKKRK